MTTNPPKDDITRLSSAILLEPQEYWATTNEVNKKRETMSKEEYVNYLLKKWKPILDYEKKQGELKFTKDD